MSESDQILARRKVVRETYGVLYDEVAHILFLHDPMGIAFETKSDEYECPRAPCSATSSTRIQRLGHCGRYVGQAALPEPATKCPSRRNP